MTTKNKRSKPKMRSRPAISKTMTRKASMTRTTMSRTTRMPTRLLKRVAPLLPLSVQRPLRCRRNRISRRSMTWKMGNRPLEPVVNVL